MISTESSGVRRSLILMTGTLIAVAMCVSPLAAQEAAHGWDASLARDARDLLDHDQRFAAAIVQDGVLHHVHGQRIDLRPGAFGIVIVTHGPDGVLVNASVQPEIYRGVVKKRALDEILSEPGMFMGMAEGLFNDERTLFVSDILPHYIFYSSEREHRYDEVHLIDGAVVGHRLVAFLWDMEGSGFGGAQERVPMSTMREDLYLSFFHTTWRGAVQIEDQSAAVHLRFR